MENKNKPGVVPLPSGLQYKVLERGDGLYHPGPYTPCMCHYSGTLVDGTKFDSSYDRGEPSQFAPSQVIKGWTEAMQLMVEGDKWELYVPYELAYGERGSPPKIPGYSALVFQIELVEIVGKDKVEALSCDAETQQNCNDQETGYLKRIENWNDAQIDGELARLERMYENKGSMKPELAGWIRRRLHILKQKKAKDASENTEEKAAADADANSAGGDDTDAADDADDKKQDEL